MNNQISIIDPSTLAVFFQQEDKKVLLIDCRRYEEYRAGHIIDAMNVCCSKLVLRRIHEKKIEIVEYLRRQLESPNDSSAPDDCKVVQIPPPDGVMPKSLAALLDSENGNDSLVVLYGDWLSLDDFASLGDDSRLSLLLTGKAKAQQPRLDVLTARTLAGKLAENRIFRGVFYLSDSFANFRTIYPDLCEASPSGIGMVPKTKITIDSHEQQQQYDSSKEPKINVKCISQSCAISQPGPTKILPFVYLGSQQDAMNSDLLKAFGINYVINMSVSCPKAANLRDENFLRIPVNDTNTEKLLPHFKKAFTFLDHVRKSKGVVLVHCMAGISRSPTLAIAYIMSHLRMSQAEAYRFVKSKRPSISPNFNFLGQLLQFERLLSANIRKLKQCPSFKTGLSHSVSFFQPFLAKIDQKEPSFNSPILLSRSLSHNSTNSIDNHDLPLTEIFNRSKMFDSLEKNAQRPNYYVRQCSLKRNFTTDSCQKLSCSYTAPIKQTKFDYNSIKIAQNSDSSSIDEKKDNFSVYNEKNLVSPSIRMARMNLSRQTTVFYTPDVEIRDYCFDELINNVNNVNMISPSAFWTPDSEAGPKSIDNYQCYYSGQSLSDPDLKMPKTGGLYFTKGANTWPMAGKLEENCKVENRDNFPSSMSCGCSPDLEAFRRHCFVKYDEKIEDEAANEANIQVPINESPVMQIIVT